jgi:hypothetical protein
MVSVSSARRPHASFDRSSHVGRDGAHRSERYPLSGPRRRSFDAPDICRIGDTRRAGILQPERAAQDASGSLPLTETIGLGGAYQVRAYMPDDGSFDRASSIAPPYAPSPALPNASA